MDREESQMYMTLRNGARIGLVVLSLEPRAKDADEYAARNATENTRPKFMRMHSET